MDRFTNSKALPNELRLGMSGCSRSALGAAFLAALMCAPWGAAAQVALEPPAAAADEQSGGFEDIVVTARKRTESALNVPVTVSVVTPQQLERLNTTQISDLPTLAPGLVVGKSLLSNGATLAIRGVGTTTFDPGVDSAISFNLDGLVLGQGLAFQSGLFDLAQIEVLKGPQALFFGKGTPGGVISLTTADPTDEFEARAKLGYDFEARTKRGELILSGPVSDTLKVRFAGMYEQSDGFFYNDVTPLTATGASAATTSRIPRTKSYMIRGTAVWKPADSLTVRLKLNYVNDKAIRPEASQYTSCPDGTGAPLAATPPFIGPNENCKLDRTSSVVSLNPANFPGVPNGGTPYNNREQKFGTLQVDYDLNPHLQLTSITALYDLDSSSLVNTFSSTYAAPPFAATNRFSREDFTQEIRLNSDFSSPVNFTLGAFYQDAKLTDDVQFIGNSAYGFPAGFLHVTTDLPIKTYSAFGQARWAFLPKWELAVGARWTREIRSETPFNLLTNVPVPVTTPKIRGKNVSPEASLTFRASNTMSFFAAYKEGFKSGSYTIGTPTGAVLDNAFGPEKVRGGEAGMKSFLLDRQLAFNVSAYLYKYRGLQVGSVEPQNGVITIKTLNAGSARVYGIDFDTQYRPASIEGLTLNFALAWNHARYKSLQHVPCWGGQLVSEGCNQDLNPATRLFTSVDLSKTQMVRAPAWQGNGGFTYSFPVGNGGFETDLTSNLSYTSKFPTYLAINRPGNDHIQRRYAKIDAGVTVRSPGGRYELSLVGKNLGNKIVSSYCGNIPAASGGGIFASQTTGGTTRGAAGVDESICFPDPGREVWLRFTVRLAGGR